MQTQSTHWQTGTQLKYGRKYCPHFHSNYAVLSSKECNVSFFVEKILFFNQGKMFLAFVCIQEVVCVCVLLLLESLIFVKHQVLAIKVTSSVPSALS